TADQEGRLSNGTLRLDVARHEVLVGDQRVELTPREFEILRVLLGQADRLVTKGRLLRAVWGAAYQGEDSYVYVHVSQLRRKLAAKEAASIPRRPVGRSVARARSVLFGRPISLHAELSERLNVFTGLAVFASDNISSSAYATEEIMRVLVLAGAGTLALTMPITIVIVVVLAIVVASYQQTIHAYPNGGGSYIVASDNLGPLAGLASTAAP